MAQGYNYSQHFGINSFCSFTVNLCVDMYKPILKWHHYVPTQNKQLLKGNKCMSHPSMTQTPHFLIVNVFSVHCL